VGDAALPVRPVGTDGGVVSIVHGATAGVGSDPPVAVAVTLKV
jgi:hypothetical protein